MKFYLFILIAMLSVAGCSTSTETAYDKKDGEKAETGSPAEKKSEGKTNASPKDAVQAFVDALEAKDEAAVKAALSEKTNKMLALQTKMTGRSIVDIFDSEEFEEMSKMPDTKNEKIDGDKATIEVKDPKDEKWDEMPLVKEDGSWKLAFADAEYDKDYERMVKEVEKAVKEKKGDKATESDADSGDNSADKPSK